MIDILGLHEWANMLKLGPWKEGLGFPRYDLSYEYDILAKIASLLLIIMNSLKTQALPQTRSLPQPNHPVTTTRARAVERSNKVA